MASRHLQTCVYSFMTRPDLPAGLSTSPWLALAEKYRPCRDCIAIVQGHAAGRYSAVHHGLSASTGPIPLTIQRVAYRQKPRPRPSPTGSSSGTHAPRQAFIASSVTDAPPNALLVRISPIR